MNLLKDVVYKEYEKGKWYAMRYKSSPYFCLVGSSQKEVMNKAIKAIESYKQFKDVFSN